MPSSAYFPARLTPDSLSESVPGEVRGDTTGEYRANVTWAVSAGCLGAGLQHYARQQTSGFLISNHCAATGYLTRAAIRPRRAGAAKGKCVAVPELRECASPGRAGHPGQIAPSPARAYPTRPTIRDTSNERKILPTARSTAARAPAPEVPDQERDKPRPSGRGRIARLPQAALL